MTIFMGKRTLLHCSQIIHITRHCSQWMTVATRDYDTKSTAAAAMLLKGDTFPPDLPPSFPFLPSPTIIVQPFSQSGSGWMIALLRFGGEVCIRH